MWLMINRLIELSLKNRFIVLALYVGLAGWGWWALGATPIDAIPDLSASSSSRTGRVTARRKWKTRSAIRLP